MPVRLLPFSMVPGMIINSRAFLKAVSIITKQQETAVSGARVDDKTPGGSATVVKGKKKQNPGAFS